MFLFFALAFGFCIVTVITSLKDGMAENVYFSAQEHYAGDLVFVGYTKTGEVSRHLDKRAVDTIFNTIRDEKIPVTRYTERTLYNDDTILFFNGNSVLLRYLNGVDWHNEETYLNNLSYASGGNKNLHDNSIILSDQVASVLGVQCGDNLILELKNNSGQKNTGNFIVEAIFKDNTVFGFYKGFISKKTMNQLLGFSEEECSSIGIFLPDRQSAEKYKTVLQKELSGKILSAPLINSDAQFKDERDKRWNGIKIFILTIPVYISDIYKILDALNLLSVFLYAMMLIIILVSASVTFNLILHERTKEIGTMRAIGFYEADIRHILICETFLLGTVSVIIGFFLSVFLTNLAGFISFAWFPSFDIFLKNGRLTAFFTPFNEAINIIAVYFVLFLAVWFPVFRTSRAPLPEMLSGSMKG
ncbi:MAG: FtsX-like permease family protein [Spirochaetaceae bacterium]|nr:FtsX-like permease family protein [Spirochaetaceae bacterium]